MKKSKNIDYSKSCAFLNRTTRAPIICGICNREWIISVFFLKCVLIFETYFRNQIITHLKEFLSHNLKLSLFTSADFYVKMDSRQRHIWLKTKFSWIHTKRCEQNKYRRHKNTCFSTKIIHLLCKNCDLFFLKFVCVNSFMQFKLQK